jgi:hypothetical protein
VIHRDRDGNGLGGQWVVAMVVLGSMAVVAGAQENPADEIGQSKESVTEKDSTTDSESGIEAVLDHIDRSARETGDQIAKTIQKMRDVQSRVNKTDTGRETQQLQKQILSDLDSLIQATRQQQQRQQRQKPQQQPHPQQQQSPQQKPSDPQQPSSTDQPAPDGRRSDGQESATQTSQAKAAASQAAQRQVILQQVWGHLPERLRERVLNMKDDRYLPKYEGLIRRYFEALAEKRGGRNDR